MATSRARTLLTSPLLLTLDHLLRFGRDNVIRVELGAHDDSQWCVITCSIGNEILEVGRPLGSAWGRRIADKVRSLDASRLVTNAVNGLLAATDVLLGTSPTDEPFDINVILSKDGVSAFGASELVTRRTEETHSQADVCGINYSEARYALDAQLFPEHILVGSETFPGALDVLWELVERHPQVIGDIAWTAWDHLGEAGVGRPSMPTTRTNRPRRTGLGSERLGGAGSAPPHACRSPRHDTTGEHLAG
ncbi:hypothetical protein ACG83_39395 [Frankia sp. R43]|nr:hypothetical protein ACG83_39395 [Frankia sp. R43]